MERIGTIDRNEWVTAAEAAQMLGTSTKYIRTLAIQYGKIDYYQLSPSVYLYYKPHIEQTTIRNRPGRHPKKPEHSQDRQKLQAKKHLWTSLEERFKRTVDGAGQFIDPGILETVVALNALGIYTIASCEGHLGPHGEDEGMPYPWVEVEAAPETIQGLSLEEEALQHLRVRAQLQEILEHFYTRRSVPFDHHLIIQGFVFPGMPPMNRLEPQGAGLQNLRTVEEKRHHLALYQEEMRAFTDFLKARFWKA
ncbi:hypothetical protein EI42_05652 [Thermosporothrix hazakensis]|jgi:hypothetical protein|uniref:Uncharacterized protein n=1 Tax=Thermosporothrix hazakensis TaxID=644383 RepID=A0A326TW29_THEHA|nr:hypothetical protein [Thermosporothrix hazakensis]PZW21116.1 hypothetical protein EI42_05652 [Thermosporothrix hazakensis]GCE50719.1 hypothetical protein KTH_55880 [Thermosporothrix hazakensis]